MKTFTFLCAVCLPVLGTAADLPLSTGDAATQNLRSAKRISNAFPAPRAGKKTPLLPARTPLPDGVTDISFDEFFKMPVGPRGLEFTDKIKALQGKKVRVAGFQVAEMVGVCNAEPDAASKARKARAMFEASVPGRIMLTPAPESVNMNHTGLCEDLPPQVVFVSVPELFGEIVPHHDAPLLLTGTLDLGNKTEPDGHVSAVRLKLDPAPVTAASSVPTISPTNTPEQTQQPTTINHHK